MHRFFVIRAEHYKIKKANTSAERWASQTKPVLGGITFYSLFLIAIIIFAFYNNPNALLNSKYIGIIIAVTVSFLMGLADDMLNTAPWFKFVLQILTAILLIYSGICISIFEQPAYNYLLTIFWVVGIMNSINMLDNMDAITTSVSITILTAALISLLIAQSTNTLLITLITGVLASLISFLYYNWNPAKMYMGDNGSQFLGSFLAIIGIEIFWNEPLIQNTGPGNYTFFVIIILAFLVPITDTTTVTINRLMRGQSPFIGGRDHTTHHLSYMGLTERKVAITLFTINSISVATAIYIIFNINNLILPVWAFAIPAIIVLVSLYATTKISKPKK